MRRPQRLQLAHQSAEHPQIVRADGPDGSQLSSRTPTVKAVFNANYLRFMRTEPLEYILFQPGVRHDIGFDLLRGPRDTFDILQ